MAKARRKPPRNLRVAFYGKGGSGKSTVAAALSSCLAAGGRRVLHIGCDPKADSSHLLLSGRQARSVMGTARDTDLFDSTSIIERGVRGIDCLESGGPEPGVGCAGRGISRTFELLEQMGVREKDYDAVVYDVLGDVVCGGFATPLKDRHTDQVVVVASQNAMSIFAANNILKAVRRFYRNGLRLAGLVGNEISPGGSRGRLAEFARRARCRLLVQIECDPAVPEAEELGKTIFDHRPRGRTARLIEELAQKLLHPGEQPPPQPLEEDQLRRFIESTRGTVRGGA